MSLTFGGEVFERRGGRLELGSGGSFTRTFLVTTDNPVVDGPYEACFCPDVPRLGDPLPSDPLYSCRTISPEPVATPSNAWYVTCEYSRRSNDPDDEPDNPLNEPVEIDISGNKVTKAPLRDLDDNPLVNSAGEPFETPIEITRTQPSVTFTRNEPFYSFANANSYVDHVNSGTYMGGAEGTVKCNDISATKAYYQSQEYWIVKYTFEYSPDGWQPQVLDQGYSYLAFDSDTSSIKRYRLKDGDGRDITTAVPLDGAGLDVDPDDLPGAAVYLTFRMYETANFDNLGLPT